VCVWGRHSSCSEPHLQSTCLHSTVRGRCVTPLLSLPLSALSLPHPLPSLTSSYSLHAQYSTLQCSIAQQSAFILSHSTMLHYFINNYSVYLLLQQFSVASLLFLAYLTNSHTIAFSYHPSSSLSFSTTLFALFPSSPPLLILSSLPSFHLPLLSASSPLCPLSIFPPPHLLLFVPLSNIPYLLPLPPSPLSPSSLLPSPLLSSPLLNRLTMHTVRVNAPEWDKGGRGGRGQGQNRPKGPGRGGLAPRDGPNPTQGPGAAGSSEGRKPILLTPRIARGAIGAHPKKSARKKVVQEAPAV
jgi:hypothetical protein